MLFPVITKDEAKKYGYNRWAANPKGNPYDESQCAYEVHINDRGGGFHQCQKKPGHGPSGLYCKQHAKMVVERLKEIKERGKRGW